MQILKRIRTVLFIALAMLFAALLLIQTKPSAAFAYVGNGTENSPYIIGSAEDWQTFFAEPDSAAYFQLSADIDLTGATVTPKLSFCGVFDGQGFAIRNFVIEENNAALFLSNNGTIKNLQIQCSLSGFVSAAAITIENNGTIDNCAVSGNVFSDNSAGGLCVTNNGVVRNSYNKAFVSGGARAAGIATENLATIESCYNSASVSSGGASGGIAAESDGDISYCYNTGEISLHTQNIPLSNYVGGLVATSAGSISNSYNIGNIRVYGVYTTKSGAIVGQLDNLTGSVQNCFFDKLAQVDKNLFENKGGWVCAQAIDTCAALSALEMSGGDNSLVFNDILYWTLLPDNLTEEKVFYPQLSCFYDSMFPDYQFDSISSVTKHYGSCLVTLYDDYGNLITEFSVFSGESILPEPFEKQGFSYAGWSASLGGARLSANTLIVLDISLYSVYDFLPIEYSLSPVTTTYGEEIYISVNASHQCTDAIISYQWYKSADSLELLEGETSDRLYLTEVAQSGFYQCKATAVCGIYSTFSYDTQKVTINPFELSVLTPVFAKTYGDDDSALSQRYTVDVGLMQEEITIVFLREEGENVGSYDILDAESANGNFKVTLIGEASDKYIITKADYTYSFSFIQSAFTYDGEEHMLSYTANLPQGLSMDITMVGNGISAGEHYITATFSGDFENYNTISPNHATMQINKATYNMSEVQFYDVAEVYDGAAHNVYMSGILPEGVDAVFSLRDIKYAGQYSTTITFEGDFDNYNAIAARHVGITILPKGLSPEFHLPENMVSDGKAKIITITADGIVDGDEVNFQTQSPQPLIAAGSYVLTAVCDNDNYILYNNTLVTQIYAAEVTNSGDDDIDMTISAPSGLRHDSEFIAESSFLGNEILSTLGSNALNTVFNLSLQIDGEDVFPEEQLTVSLTIPEGYVGTRSMKFYFYDAESGKLEPIKAQLDGRILSFDIEQMGYFVLSVVPAAQAPIENDQVNGAWLKPALYTILAVILVLIVALIYLIATGKKRAPQTVAPIAVAPKRLFEPISEQRSQELRKKLDEGTFVDWELNRDLTLYGIFAKDRIDRD